MRGDFERVNVILSVLIHKKWDLLICIYFAMFVFIIAYLYYCIEMNLHDGILRLFFHTYSLSVVVDKYVFQLF